MEEEGTDEMGDFLSASALRLGRPSLILNQQHYAGVYMSILCLSQDTLKYIICVTSRHVGHFSVKERKIERKKER